MRRRWILLAAAAALAGCKPMSAAPFTAKAPHGRYAGVGIYGPGKQWTRTVATQQAKDSPAAKPIDDQVIIVTQDSVTGEVRACGDLTGYCIGMNPWKTPLTAAQTAPINLTEHAQPPPELAAAKDRPARQAAKAAVFAPNPVAPAVSAPPASQ